MDARSAKAGYVRCPRRSARVLARSRDLTYNYVGCRAGPLYLTALWSSSSRSPSPPPPAVLVGSSSRPPSPCTPPVLPSSSLPARHRRFVLEVPWPSPPSSKCVHSLRSRDQSRARGRHDRSRSGRSRSRSGRKRHKRLCRNSSPTFRRSRAPTPRCSRPPRAIPPSSGLTDLATWEKNYANSAPRASCGAGSHHGPAGSHHREPAILLAP